MNFLVSALLWVVILLPEFANGQQSCTISLQETIKQVSCAGGMDGGIRIRANGGAAPYTYHWSNGAEGNEISSLGEGMYTVTVRDSQGCSANAQFKIISGNTTSLALKVLQTPASNKRQVLQVAFENGKKPYAITIKKISDSYRAPVIAYSGEALSEGVYLLEAFNEQGCSVTQKIKISAN